MRLVTSSDLEQDIRAAIDADNDELIARLGRDLDRLDTHPAPVSCLQAALFYAQHGLHVFPLQPQSKIPHPRSRGCKDATTDPDLIRAWFTEHPDSNVAIATGHLVDVIDIDGPVGVASWARELLDDQGAWLGPLILGRVSTPRPGGSHLYVHSDPARGNRAAMLPGIDGRGRGGYVVAPPSTNTDGTPYRWIVPLDVDALTGEAMV